MNSDSYKYLRFNTAQETRWATRDEIEQSGVHIDLNEDDYQAAGLPLLSDGDNAFVDNADTHSLIFGATGSKKTRLFCMPMVNIFAKAGESFVVTDPKGEIYAQTSGLVKEKGYKTVVLNFRDLGVGDMWNPLSLPNELWRAGSKDEAGLLLSDFVAAIAERQVSNSKDAFWPEAAQSLAIANLYVLMEAAKVEEVNLTSFTKLCAYDAVKDLKQLYNMLDKDSIPSLNYQSTVCIRADSTVSGIVSSLYGMLRIFNVNKKLAKMLSANTFDVRKFGREKTAVYLIVPDEKTTYHFLITTFIKQAYEILISEAQKEKNRQLPVRVNFVLDEFCNIPKIPDMPSMISAARSRNMRFYLVAQSLHQLKGRYGEDADTIKGNCDNWVFLTSKELSLLNEISELCGNVVGGDGRARRLISVSELQRLNKEKGEVLIMHARQYPVITEMADISMYTMFGKHESVQMPLYLVDEIESFSLENLLSEIKALRAVAPFPSDGHIINQAMSIYRQEMSELPDYQKPTKKTRFSSFLKSNGIDFDEDDKDEEEDENIEKNDPLTEEEYEKIKNECEKRAWARIADLLGEDYANLFFEQELYDSSISSSYDDDDDLF